MKKSIEFINTHPLNKSKTKQAHSFSKSPRFSRVIDGGPSYYNLSRSAVNLRPKTATVTFNKAKRFRQDQLLKKSIQRFPSPHSYKSPDFFEESAKKKKGITFTQSPKHRAKIERLPGPGQYEPNRYNPEHQPCFSIAKDEKLRNRVLNKSKQGPGPGEYQNTVIKRSSSPVTIGRQKRFKYKTDENPAPGSYTNNQLFNEESRIHENGPKFSFGSSKRNPWYEEHHLHQPGPGSYNVGFSEFSQRSQRIFRILNRL